MNEKILNYMGSHNGKIVSEEIRENKFNWNNLKELVENKKIIKVCKGYYILPNIEVDPFYELVKNSNNMIFSYSTALYLHDLSDRTPYIFDITVPLNYGGELLYNNKVKLHYVNDEIIDLGLEEIVSPYGLKIKVYDVERTICDIISNKDKIDSETYSKALKRYAESKNKNLINLTKYSQKMNIENKVMEVMEVLL